jgi:hypothetical protein
MRDDKTLTIIKVTKSKVFILSTRDSQEQVRPITGLSLLYLQGLSIQIDSFLKKNQHL